MKFSQVFVIAILCMAVAFATSRYVDAGKTGKSGAAKESTYDRVLRTGEIRCAYAANPPIFNRDPNTGQLSGIFYDVMMEVGRRLNLKIDWVEEVSYGTIAEGFQTDRYDAFCATVWPTPERSRVAAFTVPIYYSPVSLIVRNGDHRFDGDFSKLNDNMVTLSVRDGDISQAFAEESFPQAKKVSVTESSDILQPLEDVTHNKADATILEPALLYRYLKTNPGTLVDIAAEHPFRVSPNTIMMKPDQYQFKVMLDVTLTDLLNSGFVEKTLRKYEETPFLRVALPYQPITDRQ